MATKIKQITFKGEETLIGYVTSEQPRELNTVINDKQVKRSDLPRHADFVRAMDVLKPHLLIACQFQNPFDCNGNYLQGIHFKDFFADSDDEKDRFGGLDMVGILIQGKHAADGVQLFGTKTTDNGDVVNIKTPSIPLVRVPEGYNYSLVDILAPQIANLLNEAELFNTRKKHGAGLQTSADFPEPTTEKKSKKPTLNVVTDQGDLVDA